jgi:hypothetical protein
VPVANVKAVRAEWNRQVAPKLAARLGASAPVGSGGWSKRFAYFGDEEQLVVVAGAQEGTHIELALAYGLAHRAQRKLVLVLPVGHSLATQQRAAWLDESAQPDLWHYDGDDLEQVQMPDRTATIEAFAEVLKDKSPVAELEHAYTPLHLGVNAIGVSALVEWATTHPRLDHGHRRSERAWHHAGQRVLSIRRVAGGLAIRAGIHYSDNNAPPAYLVRDGQTLSDDTILELRARVADGISARADGPPSAIHRPDEHWLQAMIRSDPKLVGVEQPALREVPVWRASDGPKRWGRGYVDLLGVDGHGNVRIVETKLAENRDDLLVLQGLDYYIWAHAYQGAIRHRLGVGPAAAFEVHYVIGTSAKETTDLQVSTCTPALAHALAADVPWRFHIVTDWYPDAEATTGLPHGILLPPGALP